MIRILFATVLLSHSYALRYAVIPDSVIADPSLPCYNAVYSPDSADCSKLCDSEIRCKAYMWAPPSLCSLFGSANNQYGSSGFISGVKASSGASTLPFSFNYKAFSPVDKKIQLFSSPVIAKGRLKLTYKRKHGGYAILTDPIQLLRDTSFQCQSAYFSTQFSFQNSNLSSPGADGFSFFISLKDGLLNSGSNYLGFPDNNPIGIAIEFDNFKDNFDPDGSHIGININFNGTSVATASTSVARISLSDTRTKYVWIEYSPAMTRLSIFISTSSAKPNSPLLMFSINLCKLLRPATCTSCIYRTAAFIGFSASTRADFYQSIDIISWSFTASFPQPLPLGPLNNTGCCVSAPGVNFASANAFVQVPATSEDSCCNQCSSSLSCLSYAWYSSQRICRLQPSANNITYDQNVVGGYPSLSVYEYPTSISIQSFNVKSPLLLRGSTTVLRNRIVLTNTTSQAGYAFLNRPVQLVKSVSNECFDFSFSVAFSFAFSRSVTSEMGMGLAFFIMADTGDRTVMYSNTYNDIGLSYYTAWNVKPPGGIAVEFDLKQNAEVGDLPSSHVGINVGWTPVSSTAIMSKEFGMNLNDTNVKYAWVDYDARLNVLSVYLSYIALKPKVPILEYGVDMCQVLRPDTCATCFDVQNAFFGFSGQTTVWQSAKTDILNFQMVTTETPPINLSPGPYKFGLQSTGDVSPKQNSLFRYLSSGYISQSRTGGRAPSWRVATNWDWTVDSVNPIENQGSCGSCYAFSTVAAIESALYLANYGETATVPNISKQQIVDCSGNGKCAGGSPVLALNFSATNGLKSAAAYPYHGTNGSACSVPTGPLYSIGSFEAVHHMSWLGLLLAVQQQPVIVSVEGSTPSFVLYKSGIFNDDSCYVNGVDHNVILVGYQLVSNQPYWIIRNSWGTGWGEQGYMRMAIKSGDGICGINTVPAFIPIPKFSDSCNTQNYPYLSGIYNPDVAPGRMNPCGGGSCSIANGSNTCVCPRDFQPFKNSDGSMTCAPVSPCTFYSDNPCNVGTCVNSNKTIGTYSCICPLGYEQGVYSTDGSPTCVPVSSPGGLQNYTVPFGFTITCDLVSQMYGLLMETFLSLNKNLHLDCNRPLPAGINLNVTNSILSGCVLPYAVNKGDTCETIRVMFLLPFLNGTGSPNPQLNCSNLQPGQQVCIIRNGGRSNMTVGNMPLCTKFYSVQGSDTCASIINSQFAGKASALFYLNPGLYCANFNAVVASNNTLSRKVCVAATDSGVILQGCKSRIVTPKVGDSCSVIYSRYFCSKRSIFVKYNNNWQCQADRLFVGSSASKGRVSLCAPNIC